MPGLQQPPLARATLLDVAQRAGVSRSTASLAFSGAGPVSAATRDRVMAAAAELGYSGPDPRARSLRQGRSGVVGIVFDETLLAAFRDPVNVATLDGIASGLGTGSNGLLLLTEAPVVEAGGSLAAEQDSEAHARTASEAARDAETATASPSPIESAAIDAAVLMGCAPAFGRVVESLRRRGVPIVSIEGGPEAGVVDIALDNADASETLARHLHDLGHRRVATVTLATDVERRAGFVDAARDAATTTTVTADRLAGLRRVFPEAVAWSSSFNLVEDGVAAARALLAEADPEADAANGPDAAGGRTARPAADRPTAILAQSDLLAVGVLQVAEELGLAVPGDLSVTGFDGVRIDGLAGHDLTTMRQPATAKGRAAGLAVTRMLAGEEAESVQFTCELHLGDTTGPVPV
ncbi:LacI family DNA-binding transcriptional regulator [Herbiconiux solani]|uniref:LacI family DNA-binding transcriptional regulator n=1 Tax=Herbiconiux solani TaxID=661329 RepID=UPI000825F85D|nr:substrate-binding domain-containing protein [Herbiconiux solani]